MKKHIALIILVLFFSCKQAEKTKNSVEFKQQVEKKESEKTEIDYSEDMPTDMEYLNHNEKAIKEIDTLIIKQENLNLHLIRKTFNPKNHKIDKTKLTINGETFFGTDGDFPAYELSEIYVE